MATTTWWDRLQRTGQRTPNQQTGPTATAIPWTEVPIGIGNASGLPSDAEHLSTGGYYSKSTGLYYLESGKPDTEMNNLGGYGSNQHTYTPVQGYPGLFYSTDGSFYQVKDTTPSYAPDYSQQVAQINAASDQQVAQINAQASLDVQRMQVDSAKYQTDMNYRAAVDVAAGQVEGTKYQSDMAYRQAVDSAQISADANKDIAQGQVDLGRYQADQGYRQAVDTAKITAYSSQMSSYYSMLGQMQQAPADWIAYWYASQGQQLPQGYQGAGIPEGQNIPAWLQGAYENAGTQANRTTGLLPQEPELLGPAEYQQTPVAAWYESLPGYQGASGSQQELYRTLDPWQQRALAQATPEQMRYIAGQGQSSADYEAQRARTRYASSTPEEQAALANASPEALKRLWEAGQTPAMAGGGRMRINEPAVVMGLRSGRSYATLAENRPEEINVRPLKRFDSGGTISATPSMPPWLENLTYDRRQRYPGAQLAGTPPIPSAQYMRGMSQSQLEGLGGTAQAAGAYLPDWWDLVQYLAPKGTQFAMPVRNLYSR